MWVQNKLQNILKGKSKYSYKPLCKFENSQLKSFVFNAKYYYAME